MAFHILFNFEALGHKQYCLYAQPRSRRNCFRKSQKYGIPEDRGLLNHKCMN